MHDFNFPDEEVEEVEEVEVEEGSTGSEESFEVEIVDDTPEEDRNRTPAKTPISEPTEEELEQYSETVQKRMNRLTRARHDERRRADQLHRENQELLKYIEATKQQGAQMREYISVGQKAYIEKAKQAASAIAASAKEKLRVAIEAGDAEAIAQAQEELTSASFQMAEASNFRPTPLQTAQQPVYTQQQAPHERATPPTPSDAAVEWKDENPWFQKEGNEDMTGYAFGVHARLVRDKGEDFAGSPEYFKEIDNAMRKVFPDRFSDGKSTPASKSPSSVVAPATRSTSPRKVRLTRSQANIAKRIGIPLEEYAKQLALLETSDVN